ncbi:MAG: ABC transporter ATP-binding protein/permease [Deltaproteobacteria bacterium]|jgi:ATP-binding cassette subfamily B protein|nr:ABC transporter ATP-binding protein/permease [Deltaproteobacteria bacterium]MDL1988205.1 ABC transporter ATP-binding protein/permease [Deltaproteobacteria bacterium]
MRTDFGYFEEKQLGKPYDIKMLRRLYPFARPYRLFFILSIFLVIIITLLDLSLPYITKIAIDRYIVPKLESANFKDVRGREDKARFLEADITDPEIKAIVNKYSDQFKISGSFALISFDDLSGLDKEDLSILRKDDLAGVSLITAIFIGLILLNFVLNFLQVMLMEYTGQKIMHDLRVRLFAHIQDLSVAFFSRNPVGRLVTRVTNDTQNMHELFTSVISFVFKDIFLLFGIMFVLITINWKLALISFVVFPFVLYASLYFSSLARDAFRVLRIKVAEINTKFSETIAGIKVIQLFLREKDNYRDFKRLNHENYQAGMKQVQIFAVFMPVVELLGTVTIALVIFYGGGQALAGSISLGALVAFISYMKMFFRPIRDMAEKYNIMQNAMASAERIFLIFDNKDRLPQPRVESGYKSPAIDNIDKIEMEDVSFSYISDEPVLKNISFKIIAGETIAVVGRTGSGKTTLTNLIIRFYDPTSGRILINEKDIKNYEKSILRSKIALVMQDPFLFSGTIRENIGQGNSNISEKEMEYILEASNCKGFINRLPDGLDTVVSEGGASISSGERQLISIARAFARNPGLIILDEATSYIDSETEQKIQEAFFKLMKSRTSIIIAHRLTTARNADRIIVINKGRIIETGTHVELMTQRGFYFKLNQLQG